MDQAWIEDNETFVRLVADLTAIRKRNRLRQLDVAIAMGTTQAKVSELEGFVANPQISTLMRYARAVGARLTFDLRLLDSIL